jgi:hypothetical protein
VALGTLDHHVGWASRVEQRWQRHLQQRRRRQGRTISGKPPAEGISSAGCPGFVGDFCLRLWRVCVRFGQPWRVFGHRTMSRALQASHATCMHSSCIGVRAEERA